MKMNQLPRRRIILVGDSLTQLSFSPYGFGSHLANVYQRRADVMNRGFSGYNTEWFCDYLDTDCGKNDIFLGDGSIVCLVIIFFGANDASLKELNVRHCVELGEYANNLGRIVKKTRDYCKNARIIIVSPPPIHADGRLTYQKKRYGEKATGKLERTLENTEKYAKVAEDLSKELNLPNLNLWKEMQRSDNWEKFLCDGLHFSEEGNRFVGKRLVETINDNFPELAVTPCPFTGYLGNSASVSLIPHKAPWHDEIDYKKSKDSFT